MKKFFSILFLFTGVIYSQNIALQKLTSQSSNYYSGNIGTSDKAVDGVTNVIAQDGNTYTHTTIENNPWWKLDLGDEYDISSIAVYNRTDCCSDRLAGVKIYIGNTDSTDPNDYTLVRVLADQPFQEFLNINTTGRYILVYLEGTNKILTMAEFEVYGQLSSNSNLVNSPWSKLNNDINYALGNVGIGIASPDAKLSVNGNIHAKEVKVDLIGWSDFVFEKNYPLPSLNDVENYIIENGHLKDIPSAVSVAENGILLGEMDSKLLQKIEELTLYAIAQEKKINEQDLEIELLKKERAKITFLAARILEIEKLLENKNR